MVLLVLALLAGITVPRIVGQERRAFDQAAEGVADLLMMYAQRAAHAQRPAGIMHDSARHSIVLMVLDIDPARPDDPPDWRPDPYVRPVRLPRGVGRDGVLAFAGGERLDFSQWPVSSAPGQERETVEIRLFSEDGSSRAVVLPGHSISPYQAQLGGDAATPREPIDLDAAGRTREEW